MSYQQQQAVGAPGGAQGGADGGAGTSVRGGSHTKKAKPQDDNLKQPSGKPPKNPR